MEFFPITILVSCIVFLFVFYVSSVDDLLFMRKSIPLERLFDICFGVLFMGLFVSRMTYVVYAFEPRFLHPLVFLLFTYFPGLSFAGGVVGAVCYLLFAANRGKLPVLHLADIFSLSFIASVCIGSLLELVFMQIFSLRIIIPLLYLVLFLVLRKLFIKNIFHTGSYTMLGISLFAIIAFVGELLRGVKPVVFFLNIESMLLLLLFAVAFLLFIKEEKSLLFKRFLQ